ncbi:MAG: hypothetical protein JWP74_3849 [Marmoricola sp.]|nr:hypothetical protein [Marmoricola sp.]
MPAGDIETYFHGTEWHCRVEGGSTPFHTSDTKARAVAAGKDRAKADAVEHIVKNKDGQIGERSTYGHDPRNVPG